MLQFIILSSHAQNWEGQLNIENDGLHKVIIWLLITNEHCLSLSSLLVTLLHNLFGCSTRTVVPKVFTVNSRGHPSPIQEIHKMKIIMLFASHSRQFISIQWIFFLGADRRIQPFSTTRHFRNLIKSKTTQILVNLQT